MLRASERGHSERDFTLVNWHFGVKPLPLSHSFQSKAEHGHKVRLAVGSGLRPDTWERFVRRFGPLQVLETYGLTEGNVATFNYTGQRGAVGRASWLYKVRGTPQNRERLVGRRVHATGMTRAGPPFPQHIFPFSLIRYDVTTGEPVRDAQGHCVATSPGLCSGGVGGGGEGGLEVVNGVGPGARKLWVRWTVTPDPSDSAR